MGVLIGSEPPDTEPLDLAALVRAIDREWPGWEHIGPRPIPAPWGFLVGVTRAATGSNGARLAPRPLATHPAVALRGWSAAAVWCAVGVAVRGTAHRTTGTRPPSDDARVIWVCHRDGRSASLLGLPGEPAAVVVRDGPPPDAEEGRIPALLRQSLNPQPPPALP